MKGTSEETRFTVLERKTTSNSIISLGHGRCSSSDCFAGDVPHCTASTWTKSSWQSSCPLERLAVMVISSQWDSFSFVCTCDLAHNEPESFQPKGLMDLKVFSRRVSQRCTFADPEKWKCAHVWCDQAQLTSSRFSLHSFDGCYFSCFTAASSEMIIWTKKRSTEQSRTPDSIYSDQYMPWIPASVSAWTDDLILLPDMRNENQPDEPRGSRHTLLHFLSAAVVYLNKQLLIHL